MNLLYKSRGPVEKKRRGGGGANGVLEKKMPNLAKPEAVFIQTLTMFYFQLRD